MATTTIKNAIATTAAPKRTGPISTRIKTTGSSSIRPTFVGVVPGDSIIVVFKTGIAVSDAKVITNEVVGTEAAGNDHILAFVDQKDAGNWTIVVRSDKDGPGNGETFIAGTG